MNGKLTIDDVAKTLGCGEMTVKNMVKAGILTDLREGKHKEGGKKHYMKFTAKQVKAIARIYKPRMGIDVLKTLLSSPPPIERETVGIKSHPTPPQPKITAGIMSRLDSIEKMLTTLVQMWS